MAEFADDPPKSVLSSCSNGIPHGYMGPWLLGRVPNFPASFVGVVAVDEGL